MSKTNDIRLGLRIAKNRLRESKKAEDRAGRNADKAADHLVRLENDLEASILRDRAAAKKKRAQERAALKREQKLIKDKYKGDRAKARAYIKENGTAPWEAPAEKPWAPLPPLGVAIKGYKAVRIYNKYNTRCAVAVLELLIPAHVYRCMGKEDYNGNSYGDNKCRASEAIVIRCIRVKNRNRGLKQKLQRGDKFFSDYNSSFEYKRGQLIIPDHYDHSKVTCSEGIHFFTTVDKAYDYLN